MADWPDTPEVAKHVVLDGNVFVCRHCGARYLMNLPCPVDVFAAAACAYSDLHRHCEPQ